MYDSKLEQIGHLTQKLSLPEKWSELVGEKKWEELDQEASKALAEGGFLREALSHYIQFSAVEWIISLRQSPDEDGIWHDDGSRKLAFSLSLTQDLQQLKGGSLLMRKKTYPLQVTEIKKKEWGELVIFATGQLGWDHKTAKVQEGQRVVLAGWCTGP